MINIKVGISACLLGHEVRFNGNHKLSRYCQDYLNNHFNFVTICPEVAIGMGIPRPAIRLVRSDKQIKALTSDEKDDYTEPLANYIYTQKNVMKQLDGYILCAKSPTCGMERVKIYNKGAKQATREGVGIFAEQLINLYPSLPVEEDGRLNDPILRENFITRVFAHNDWRHFCENNCSKHELIQFHSRYKYLLMAHSYQQYSKLGHLLAKSNLPLDTLCSSYMTMLMDTLKIHATRKSHTNVLQHIMGYLKKEVPSKERQSIAVCIDKYRKGLLPLLAPITLINHYIELYPNSYIESQVYLKPHPEELVLRYGA